MSVIAPQGMPRALCAHAIVPGKRVFVSTCGACAIAESIDMGRVSSTARFVIYVGTVAECHGLIFHVVAARDGRLNLVEVAPDKPAYKLRTLTGARYASVSDLGYAGRYEAVEVAEAAAAL